ncbi:MAG: hypothetical protein ACFFCZ_26530, partial [Promethearchaeota archaeon]
IQVQPRTTTLDPVGTVDTNIYYQESLIIHLNLTDTVNNTRIQVESFWNATGISIKLTRTNLAYFFEFTFDSSEVGNFTITINFNQYGYVNQSWVENIEVDARTTSLTLETTIPDSLYYFQLFYLNFTLMDLNTSTAIIDANFLESYNNTKLIYISGTFFNFSFDSSVIGSFSLVIKFSQYGYQNQTWTDVIEVGIVIATELQYSSVLNDVITLNYSYVYFFTITYYDRNASAVITNVDLRMLNDTTIAQFITSNTSGDFFAFTAGLSNVGFFALNITWGKYGYANQSIILRFNVIALPTILSVPAELETGRLILNYSHSFSFILVYEDINHTERIYSNYNRIITGNLFFIEENSSGIFFLFNASLVSLGSFDVTITFSKFGYESQVFSVQFIVQPMVTNSLEYSGLINSLQASENFPLVINWTDAELIALENANITIIWNETHIFTTGTNANVTILYLGNGSYLLTFNGGQIPKGFYNITIEFGQYGYQNQSLNFQFTLIPYSVWINVDDLGDTVIRGSPFVIKIIVTKGFGTYRFQSRQVEESFTNAIIILSFTYTDLNGTQQTLLFSGLTDYLGVVEFVINGTLTKNISTITKILVSYNGDSSSGASSLDVDSSLFPQFQNLEPPFEEMIAALLPYILIVLVILSIVGGTLVVASRKRTVSRETRAAYTGQVTQNFQQVRSLGSILIRTKTGVPIYSENFLSMEGDEVTLSAMTTAISSFIQDVAQKTLTGAVKSSEFEEMTKAGFNMLARDGEFISIVLLSDTPLGDFIKDNLCSLQKELETTLHDELENFFSVEDLDLEVFESLVAKYLYTSILKNMRVDETQLVQKRKMFTPTEQKIIESLKYVPRTAGTATFLADSFISEMKRRGVPQVDAKGFLLKINQLGLLSAMSFEELREKQNESDSPSNGSSDQPNNDLTE